MIGGNLLAQLQTKAVTKNEIGEHVLSWETRQTLTGFLDYLSGDSPRTAYDTKLQESTHIFICNYAPLATDIDTENARMVINGKTYDIKIIDNPMELNAHYEIFLKYTGGQ